MKSRPLHYLIFWIVWTLSPWNISPTGFPKGKLLFDHSEYVKDEHLYHSPGAKSYSVKLSKLAGNFLPAESALIHGGSTSQEQPAVASVFSVSPWARTEAPQSGRSQDPLVPLWVLCFSEPLLPLGFWKLQRHSQHHIIASRLLTKITNTFWWHLLCCEIIQCTSLEQYFIAG